MDDELVCEACGDDLACEGWVLCLECLENMTDVGERYRRKDDEAAVG